MTTKASRTTPGRIRSNRHLMRKDRRRPLFNRGRRSFSTQVRQYSFRLVRPCHNHDSRAGPELVLVDDLRCQSCKDCPVLSAELPSEVLGALDLMTLAARHV